MVFSYYGSKSKIVHLYPKPVYPLIIEPFAGSARYALKYRTDHQVWINDIYPVVYRIWKWIQQATKQDVRNLPELKLGTDLRDLPQLSEVVRDLLGFVVNMGAAMPHHVVSSFSYFQEGGRGGSFRQIKNNLLELVGEIDDWRITCLDYKEMENKEATWYIDPPYVKGGARYKHNQIDYPALAKWCQERKGQVIVCEGDGADWLPFRPLIVKAGYTTKNRRIKAAERRDEVIWTRCDKKVGLFALDLKGKDNA